MKRSTLWIVGIMAFAQQLCAETHYVSLSGGHEVPYTSWGTAATNIQAAVDVAVAGDTVVVTDGIYCAGGVVLPGHECYNRVLLTNDIVLCSVNGAEATVIAGGYYDDGVNDPITMRGVFMTDGVLEGFTVSNGYAQKFGNGCDTDCWGGGVFCEVRTCHVTNCMICGNWAWNDGGGVWGGSVYHCTIQSNSCEYYGGGLYDSVAHFCTISSNSSENGGGTYGGEIYNSVLTGNDAGDQGGGAYESVVSNCVVCLNSAKRLGGGTYGGVVIWCTTHGNVVNAPKGSGGGACNGRIENCVITNNEVYYGAGVSSYYDACSIYNSLIAENIGDAWAGAYYVDINNCTLADNMNGGTYYGSVNNSIVWNNTWADGFGNEFESNYYGSSFGYSCTYPLGNITNDPQFVSESNYRLQSTSPCINAGTNELVVGNKDLIGNVRVHSSTVDMGCYEYVPEPGGVAVSGVLALLAWARRALRTRR